MLSVTSQPLQWSRVSDLRRPLRCTKPMRRYLRLPGAQLETAPGLAPGKGRVAACRLDDFGIAVIGEAHGTCTRSATFTGSNAALTTAPPYKLGPAAGNAPAWARLQNACITFLPHRQKPHRLELVFPPRIALGTRPSRGRMMICFTTGTKPGGSRRSCTVPFCASDRRSPPRAFEPSFRTITLRGLPVIDRPPARELRKGNGGVRG